MGDPTRYQSRHLLFEILYFTIEIRYLFAGIHHSAQFIFEYFSLYMMFCKNVVLHGHFFHLHSSMLGVDRCCKRQTLFKCHKSRTECLECSKTLGRRLGTPPLLRPFGLELLPFKPRAYRDPHLLLSNLTTAYPRTLVWTAVTDIGFHRVWSNVRRPRR